TRLAPVANAGQRLDPALDQRCGRLHVHYLGAARITDRAGAADEQHAIFVDLQRRIVDAPVIILRTVGHDRAPFECLWMLRIRKIAVAELLRNHARLHDRAVEQVAAQHDESGLLDERTVVSADYLAVPRTFATAVLARGLAVHRARALTDLAGLDQFG